MYTLHKKDLIKKPKKKPPNYHYLHNIHNPPGHHHIEYKHCTS